MDRSELESLTLEELRKRAANAKIAGRSKLKKSALVDALCAELGSETEALADARTCVSEAPAEEDPSAATSGEASDTDVASQPPLSSAPTEEEKLRVIVRDPEHLYVYRQGGTESERAWTVEARDEASRVVAQFETRNPEKGGYLRTRTEEVRAVSMHDTDHPSRIEATLPPPSDAPPGDAWVRRAVAREAELAEGHRPAATDEAIGHALEPSRPPATLPPAPIAPHPSALPTRVSGASSGHGWRNVRSSGASD